MLHLTWPTLESPALHGALPIAGAGAVQEPEMGSNLKVNHAASESHNSSTSGNCSLTSTSITTAKPSKVEDVPTIHCTDIASEIATICPRSSTMGMESHTKIRMRSGTIFARS
jgi:hypothetical protein